MEEWKEDHILLEIVEKRKNLEDFPKKLCNSKNDDTAENTSPISMMKQAGHKFGNSNLFTEASITNLRITRKTSVTG